MKKLLILTVLLCIGSYAAQAQRYFMFGPKVSYSVNSFEELRQEDRIEFKNFNTASAGLFARINLGALYIQPETYFLVKGADYSLADNVRESGKIRLRTFETPVLLGYHLINGQSLNLRVFGGPVFNLYTKETENDLKVTDPNRYSFDKNVNSLQAGLGVDLLMFTVDARYEWGLSRLNEPLGIRQKQFMISLGYKLFER